MASHCHGTGPHVGLCDFKKKKKISYGQLKPLEILYSHELSISMQCIMDLLKSNNYTAIYIIVNRFTKIPN